MSDLHKAARQGDVDRVKSLLDQGSQIDAKDHIHRTALHLAAYDGQVHRLACQVSRKHFSKV